MTRRGRLGAVVVSLAVGLVAAACGSSAEQAGQGTVPTTALPPTTAPAPPPPTTSVPAAELKAPAVPTTGAYLGAWLHPVPAGASSGPAFAVEQRTLPTVQAVTGRTLAILHIYAPWQRPAPAASLAAVAADGSIPLLDWGCAGNGAQVAAGADDALITAYARALKAFGKPVFLRWCWEMNLARSHPQVGGPTGFTSAWVHIWTLFHQAGATNVAFVWCPAVTGAAPAPYYPGDAYVDWIAIDGYDRTGTRTFASLFTPFEQQWSGHGKPMMVAETGSPAASQAAYVGSIAIGMPSLPAFKAVVYFDAPGPARDFSLVGTGLQAFGALAENPYFTPTTS